MFNRNNIKNKKGVTLIELIIAMAIFGMIMVSIFPAFIILNLTNIVSKENVSANYLAQRTSEELYQLGKDNTLTVGTLPGRLNALGFYIDGSGHYVNNLNADFIQVLTVTLNDPVLGTGFARLLLIVESRHNYTYNSNTINDYRSQIESIIPIGN